MDGMNYFKKGEIVWAKMKYYSPWPAKVTKKFTIINQDYENKKHLTPK